MNPLGIRIALMAILLGVAAWWVNGYLNRVEQRGYDRAVAEYNVKLLAAQEAARVKETALNAKLQEAQNAHTQRQSILQADAAATRTERDSLRHQLDAATASLSDASTASVRKYAATLADVFGQCTKRLEEMGGAAQGHASDSLMYQEAWPK